MTTLLFANIAMSGIKVITSVPMTRRVRFIVAVAVAFGLGVTIVPSWTANLLPCDEITNGGLQGLCMGAELTLTTGYAIGCVVGLILHALLPSDIPEVQPMDMYDESVRRPSEEQMAHLRVEADTDTIKSFTAVKVNIAEGVEAASSSGEGADMQMVALET